MLYSEAKTRLERMLAASDDPVLSAAVIADLLIDARRLDDDGFEADDYPSWAPSVAFAVGAEIVPTVRNGHFYEVTVADADTGAAEPAWPTTSGALVTLAGYTYQEAGYALWGGAWDLEYAAAEGWRLKAALCASRFNFSSDVSNFMREQIFKHCLEMVAHYASRSGGGGYTLRTGEGVVYDPVIGNLNAAP